MAVSGTQRNLSSRTVIRIFKELSWPDRLLPLLILLAIIVGVLISVYAPSARDAFNSHAQLEGVSVPLAVGLIVMMIPPLCKVEWENIHEFARQKRFLHQIGLSLFINWIVGPFVMFGLAWATLFDEPEYRTGIIMIGLARCIAMVLVWNELAQGDNTLCAVTVLINSMLQIVLFAPYQIFFCYVITGTSSSLAGLSVTYPLVAKSVAVFLGVPLGFGILIRVVGMVTLGKSAYQKYVVRFVSPWALIGLLYTIIVIFIQKGDDFIRNIGSAFRCFAPLIVYFVVMWFGTFFLTRFFSNYIYRRSARLTTLEKDSLLCGCEDEFELASEKWNPRQCSANYAETITQTFTAASNNFELSLAVAISIYGSGSKQAIAATFGPLLEVPILLALTFVARVLREKYLWVDVKTECDDE